MVKLKIPKNNRKPSLVDRMALLAGNISADRNKMEKKKRNFNRIKAIPKINDDITTLFRMWNLFDQKINISKVNMGNKITNVYRKNAEVSRSYLAGTLKSKYFTKYEKTRLVYFPPEIEEPKTTKDFQISLDQIYEILSNKKYKDHDMLVGLFYRKIALHQFFLGDSFLGSMSPYILCGIKPPKLSLQDLDGVDKFINYWNTRYDSEFIFDVYHKEDLDNFLIWANPEYLDMKNKYPITTRKYKDQYEFLFYLVFGVLRKVRNEGKIIITPRALNGVWFRNALEEYRIETGHTR